MRARNLKPSFFLNSKLADIPPIGRLLFQGLWCMADRRGRLEDDPKKIKASILPYDETDVSTMLEQLQHGGFIIRYESKSNHYIQVINFEKHQYPHIKESESSIPAPYKHHASTVQKRLNPESPILNPESPIHISPSGDTSVYELPDPKTDPLRCLVLSYKTMLGVPYDDRIWDKKNFSRNMGAAKELLHYCKNFPLAEKCLKSIAENMESIGRTWTFETVTKLAPNWLKKGGFSDENSSKSGLRMAIARQRSKTENQGGLVKVSEGSVLDAFRDGKDSPGGDQADGSGERRGLNDENVA